MNTHFHENKRIKNLLSVLDEYSAWFMRVVRVLTYPNENVHLGRQILEGGNLGEWIDLAREDGFEPEITDKLYALHREMTQSAERMVHQAVNSKRASDYRSFNELVVLFEEFSFYLRRLEKDLLLDDRGIDSLTGLRSFAVMHKDIRREMDRFSRQGKPFCLGLIRLMNPKDVQDTDYEEFQKKAPVIVANTIMQAIRSFDEAYRLDNGEFILSLKQSDITGGVRAMERINYDVEKKSENFLINGVQYPVKIISGVVEPVPGDDIDELILNLRSDLDETELGGGHILQYADMSPIQRFLSEKSNKDTGGLN